MIVGKEELLQKTAEEEELIQKIMALKGVSRDEVMAAIEKNKKEAQILKKSREMYPGVPAEVVRERAIIAAAEEDRRFQEQKKNEEEAQKAAEGKRTEDWYNSLSQQHKKNLDFVLNSNIEGDKRRAFYNLIKWCANLEKQIQELEKKLDAKTKELENRIEFL